MAQDVCPDLLLVTLLDQPESRSPQHFASGDKSAPGLHHPASRGSRPAHQAFRLTARPTREY